MIFLKLKAVKKYDQEILQLCAIKEIERGIELAEHVISRVLDVKKINFYFFAKKEISDTIKSPVQDVPIPDKDTPPVETPKGGGNSSVYVTDDANQNEQISVNAIQGSTSVIAPNGSNQGTINPNSCNPSKTSQPSAIFETYAAKSKLPKITLPRFKGNITEFRPFWNSFENAVHRNKSLPCIEKFNYLHSLPDGSALQVIKGLALTEENFQIAIDLRKQRYGNIKVVLSAHMDEMLKL